MYIWIVGLWTMFYISVRCILIIKSELYLVICQKGSCHLYYFTVYYPSFNTPLSKITSLHKLTSEGILTGHARTCLCHTVFNKSVVLCDPRGYRTNTAKHVTTCPEPESPLIRTHIQPMRCKGREFGPSPTLWHIRTVCGTLF